MTSNQPVHLRTDYNSILIALEKQKNWKLDPKKINWVIINKFCTLLLLDFLPSVSVCLPGIFEQVGLQIQIDFSRMSMRYPED